MKEPFLALSMLACLTMAPSAALATDVAGLFDRAKPVESVDGVVLQAEVIAWRLPGARAASPGVVMRKPGISVHIALLSRGSRPYPGLARVDHIWLIYGRQTWESDLAFATQEPMLSTVTIRNGPEWPTGGMFDCVVRIVDKDHKTHYLRAAAVPIQAFTR